MDIATRSIHAWLSRAQDKLEAGTLGSDDLTELRELLAARGRTLRQRLMYMHAITPNPSSGLVHVTIYEPTPDGVPEITAEEQPLPYNSVLEAVRDGWQIIHFPNQLAPFDDKEIDILGYEFVLQKLEAFDE